MCDGARSTSKVGDGWQKGARICVVPAVLVGSWIPMLQIATPSLLHLVFSLETNAKKGGLSSSQLFRSGTLH